MLCHESSACMLTSPELPAPVLGSGLTWAGVDPGPVLEEAGRGGGAAVGHPLHHCAVPFPASRVFRRCVRVTSACSAVEAMASC